MHIVLTENCTADGVIDMAANWFDPADHTDDQLMAATQAPGRLGVTGSISVAQQLVGADLVDEYRLFVHPVLIGAGAGVLAGARHLDLDLIEATPFPSGITLLRYERRR